MEQTLKSFPAIQGEQQAQTVPEAFRFLRQSSAWLTWTGVLMLADIAVSLAGLVLDPTLVTGAPVWLKPLKFGISTSLYCFTVAWMIGQLHRTRSFAAILGRLLAAALTVEIVLIDMQAARHTTSHFNYTTTFDSLVFAMMGIGIATVLVSTILLLVVACVERIADKSLAWAIRLSLLLALLGMGVGSLMTLPTPEQSAAQHRAGGRMPYMGGHTVGAPDGGPGMPVTGWSADHGDLRIAHFLGLHAMQVLLLVWWLAHRQAQWSGAAKLRLIVATAISVSSIFGVVLWQALRGQPLLHPDAPIAAGYASWAASTLLLCLWAIYQAIYTAKSNRVERAIPWKTQEK